MLTLPNPSGRTVATTRAATWVLALSVAIGQASCGEILQTADASTDSADGSSQVGSGVPVGPGSVLTGHGHPTRDAAFIDKAMTHERAATLELVPGFDATFDGADFGQPLYVDGAQSGQDVVYVATNTNNVAAFDTKAGKMLWSRALGEPVPPAYLPCHQPISQPYGILSTPAIDPDTRTLFTEAFVLGGDALTTPVHLAYALSIDDGTTRPGWPINVDGVVGDFFATVQHQRGSILVLNGTVYFPYSGSGSDCEPPTYHGWIVGISIADPTKVTSWHTEANRGGIWGALASDGTNLYFSTGNTYQLGPLPPSSTWGGGEGVFRLGPDLTFDGGTSQYFAPSNWLTLDERDLDLGSGSVVLVDLPGAKPSSLVVAMGKQGTAYLEDRENLGGIGKGNGETGEGLFSALVDEGGVWGNPATYVTAKGRYVVTHAMGNGVACPNGTSGNLIALKLHATSPPTFSTAWCAEVAGMGSPMVTTTDGASDPIVWVTTAQATNLLLGFDGDTGAPVFTGGGITMAPVIRWTNPIAAEGRLYVAATGRLYAFEPKK